MDLTGRLAHINSMTKYPPIPTYHQIDPKNGMLGEPLQAPEGLVVTEKVDGANTRVIVFPDGDFIIGSKEELLHAKGDRVISDHLGIVEAALPAAVELAKDYMDAGNSGVATFYLETFGGSLPAWKNYTKDKTVTGLRLFDVASLSMVEFLDMLDWPRAKVALWRDNGGQHFRPEDQLCQTAQLYGLNMVPAVKICSLLPTEVQDTLDWMKLILPRSQVFLTAGAAGNPEGVVARSRDRSFIVKLRFEDYERTLRRQAQRQG